MAVTLTSPRRRLAAAAVVAVLLVCAALAALRSSGADSQRLGDAHLFADGGEVSFSAIARGEKADPSLDDVRVSDLKRLIAGTDDRLLALWSRSLDDGLLEASSDGGIEKIGLTEISGFHHTAFGIAADGSAAVAIGGDAPSEILVRGFDWAHEGDFEARFAVGAIALDEARSMLLGSRHEARIDAVSADGTISGLLGPPGSDARVILDKPLGPVTSLMRLPDGRVVFVADTADGYEINVLDDTAVRALFDTILERSPVATSCAQTCMTPIAPAPEGRVLATGIGRRGDPEISVVDVDSGEVEVLVVLEDVEPTIDEPVSAAAVGEDLVFLAEGKLWKLEDAFPTG